MIRIKLNGIFTSTGLVCSSKCIGEKKHLPVQVQSKGYTFSPCNFYPLLQNNNQSYTYYLDRSAKGVTIRVVACQSASSVTRQYSAIKESNGLGVLDIHAELKLL